MTDVVIRKLRLNVVRHGTFFWGEDPKALARRVMGVLGPMLEARFSELDEEGADLEITEPVRCTLRLSGSQVLAAGITSEREWLSIRRSLDEAIAPALRRAMSSPSRPREGARAAAQRSAPPKRRTSALATLMPIHLLGQLQTHLQRSRGAVLQSLHDELWVHAPGTVVAEPSAADLAELERLLVAIAQELNATGPVKTKQQQQRRRLVAAVRCAAELGLTPLSNGARRTAERVFPLGPGLPDEPAAGFVPGASGAASRVATHAGSAPADSAVAESEVSPAAPDGQKRGRTQPAGAPVEVQLLPLLVAAALDRAGALDAFAEAVAPREQPLDLPLLVAAFALALGPKPRRGWLHEPATLARAAASAGIAVLAPDALTHLAGDSRLDFDTLSPGLSWDPTKDPALAGLLAQRPVAPLARTDGFQRLVERWVGWALAALGASLWPEENAPGSLVVERFASLECRFGRGDDGFTALIPLGLRRAHLAQVGALADLSRASWLGAPLSFRGG